MVGQLTDKGDISGCTKSFMNLDVDNDGTVNQEELVRGYTLLTGNRQEAEETVIELMKKVDMDGSGQIDYSEWVIATIDKKKLLTDAKLKAAFNLFDEDGGGTITADEVKEVLCQGQNVDIDDDVWIEVIN